MIEKSLSNYSEIFVDNTLEAYNVKRYIKPATAQYTPKYRLSWTTNILANSIPSACIIMAINVINADAVPLATGVENKIIRFKGDMVNPSPKK